MPQIKTLPSTVDAISKPSSPSFRVRGSGARYLSWTFPAVLEGARRRRRFSSPPSIPFCLTQYQRPASISTPLLDPTLVAAAWPGSFSVATSQELIRAPGTRNQPERPRGREAKQADLGTIYSGRPPINPASNRQHDSNKRSMLLSSNSQAPLDLWRSSLVAQGFDIPIRHGLSHSTPAGEADVTSSDSIRAAMTSSQPQLDF